MELNFKPSHPVSYAQHMENHIGPILSYSPYSDPHLDNSDPHLDNSVADNAKSGGQLDSSKATHSKPRYLNFEGSGSDRDHFHCAGYLHAVSPQQGIPGWQRITLMKYALDAHGFFDPGSCWAYEGIVLPGRQIILGRWWSPFHTEGDDAICGPFIFWNVRKPGGDGALPSPDDSGSEHGH